MTTNPKDVLRHADDELKLIGKTEQERRIFRSVIETIQMAETTGFDTDEDLLIVRELFEKRLLSPITNHPDEWVQFAAPTNEHPGFWRNVRCNEAISMDGGAIFILLDREFDRGTFRDSKPWQQGKNVTATRTNDG